MSRFYVAWIAQGVERQHSGKTFSETDARELAATFNAEFGRVLPHFAIPEEHIEAWKAGTWTPQ